MTYHITIVGGTGMIGSALSNFLLEKGHQVSVLTRNKKNLESKKEGLTYHSYDLEKNEWPNQVFENTDVLINLAGRNLGDKRWNAQFKEDVYKSRIKLTHSLVDIFTNVNTRSALVINGSAIGYYGMDRGEELLDETSEPGHGFLADLCVDWEKEAKKYTNGRLVLLRTGIVLANEGGAYPKLKNPILLGMGSGLASGRQWMSWIHLHDLIQSIYFIIRSNDIEGVVNATAPNPVRNRRLIGEVSDSLNKAILLPRVPSLFLRLGLGEFADSVIGGLHAAPNKLTNNGFLWKYDTIDKAVQQLNWPNK